MSCFSFAFSLWFGLVSHKQNIKQTKIYHQKSWRSCHSVRWSEIKVVGLSLVQLFAEHYEHFKAFILFFLAVGLKIKKATYFVAAQGQPRYMFVLQHAASCRFTKLPSAHSAQWGLLQELVSSKNAQIFLQPERIEVYVHNTNKLYQSLFVAGLTPVWRGGLGCSGLHPSLITVFTPKRTRVRTIWTKPGRCENTLKFVNVHLH